MISSTQRFLLSSVLAASLVGGAHAATPAPEGAAVYFLTPTDGQTVSSPVTVRFGLDGMGVAPAGVEREGTGHHHLLVDVDELPAMDQPVPSDEHHRHFGGGQTQTSLELSPGQHTLQLLVGDHQHVPHEPPVMSEKITITVE
ncbi:DUF4399 domain-containing protein [Marinobacter pelagius]|uniref:DUF4399 domain-containing protein n=1 Tax=Marinobacter sp. C7 TaxID=2951363 RepID=UPI001EF0BBF9|nr:DUF4399 domain-containing protein [Marinobacter sp. C7]MCG7198764.1 DUF4399 domain-containing protein [Marinobacter sp. C7]